MSSGLGSGGLGGAKSFFLFVVWGRGGEGVQLGTNWLGVGGGWGLGGLGGSGLRGLEGGLGVGGWGGRWAGAGCCRSFCFTIQGLGLFLLV